MGLSGLFKPIYEAVFVALCLKKQSVSASRLLTQLCDITGLCPGIQRCWDRMLGQGPRAWLQGNVLAFDQLVVYLGKSLAGDDTFGITKKNSLDLDRASVM